MSHPAIEAAERLHPRLAGRRPVAVRVRCHPLVVELTGERSPTTGLAARFSTAHGVAAGLVDGRVGLAQYDDDRVVAPDINELRDAVVLVVDPGLDRDAATVEVTLDDGGVLAETVEHVRGSVLNPMTDAEQDTKVRDLVDRTWPGQAPTLITAMRSLATAPSCAELLGSITKVATCE